MHNKAREDSSEGHDAKGDGQSPLFQRKDQDELSTGPRQKGLTIAMKTNKLPESHIALNF